MPVEIKEIVIKTTIHSNQPDNKGRQANDWSEMRREILESCRRMISEQNKKTKYKR